MIALVPSDLFLRVGQISFDPWMGQHFQSMEELMIFFLSNMSDMVGSLKVFGNVNWISKEMNPQSQSFQHGAVTHYNTISTPCFTMLFEFQILV